MKTHHHTNCKLINAKVLQKKNYGLLGLLYAGAEKRPNTNKYLAPGPVSTNEQAIVRS
jgi:hypothetical protein